MTIFQAFIYGLLQGLTEFLPISSTAHIRIAPALLGWPDPGAAFTAVIQIGTLAAVLIYFARDIRDVTAGFLRGLIAGKPFEEFHSKLAWMIGVGTIPIVVCGLLFKDDIETTLRSLYVIAASMIALAVLLMAAEELTRRRTQRGIAAKRLESLGWGEAIAVGFAQAMALIPGSSRSGTTITGGLFAGLSRETAARFSFLLSIPSVFAAGVFELYQEREALLSQDVGVTAIVTATIVSGVVGYASIAFLLDYLKRNSTFVFIVYRLLLGSALLILLRMGILNPL